MKIKVKCTCCDGGKKPFKTAEGKRVPCPYCKDTGERDERAPHPSHLMGDWHTDIRCPGSTPRFYGVRECSNCGEEELRHAAGHFLNQLEAKCTGI